MMLDSSGAALRRPRARRLVVVGLAVAALSALSPQSAFADVTTTNGPCTVTAYTPYIEWISGTKYARANFRVYCSSTRTVTVAKRIYDNDQPANPDDLVASHNESLTFSGWATFGVRGRCADFDGWGNEELYSKAAITIGYVTSSWARSGEVSLSC